MLEENICKNKNSAGENNFYLCINESPWHHHFAADIYIAVKHLSQQEIEQLIREKYFVKLAIKFPLQQWNAMPVLLDKSFADIMELLKA